MAHVNREVVPFVSQWLLNQISVMKMLEADSEGNK